MSPINLDRETYDHAGHVRRFRITVIGDLRLEMRTALPGHTFTQINDDVLCFAPIKLIVAGTAMNMARAATRLFEDTHVIAKIGSDAVADVIASELAGTGAQLHLIAHEGPNGLIIVVRDRADEHSPPGGVRLLVSSTPAPNWLLTAEEIVSRSTVITDSDLLFVDGYSLLGETSRAAVAAAMCMARQAGTKVCLDVVPHRIDEHLRFGELERFVALADFVIAEARTLARLLALPAPYPFRDQHLVPVLGRLAASPYRGRRWIIRFGDGDMQDALIHQPGGADIRYQTHYNRAVMREGFGDQVAAFELFQLLGQTSSAG